jgi:hypothetical protein
MWHYRFFGALLTVLAILGFIGSQTALASYPGSAEFSKDQATRGAKDSFRLAVVGGGSAIPLGIPTEPSPEKKQPAKSTVEKPKATQKKKSENTSTPKKKKVKKADVKNSPAEKPVEEEGFLTKTFKQLVGSDDDKKEATSKPQLQKTAGKKYEPAKEEEGLFTKTLKTLVGGDKKEEKTAKKNTLDPINVAPTGSASSEKKEEEKSKTAKSETKKTLKDSFEKLIAVGAVKEDDKASQATKPAEPTKSAKTEESGGFLDGILGGSKKKKDTAPAPKQAKVEDVEDTVEKTPAPAKPKRITAKKYVADEEEEEPTNKSYGGAQKGKNVLKESFKTLVTDDKKQEEE